HTRGLSVAEAKPALGQVVDVARRALGLERKTPPRRREVPMTEAFLCTLLGVCLERLGDIPGAIAVYSSGLAHDAMNPDLLTSRGIARLQTDPPGALSDLRRAVEAGTQSVWPYYVLAEEA